MEDFSPIIASIYEAAVFPENWPHVILSICKLLDFWSGAAITVDGTEQTWAITPNPGPFYQDYVDEGWASRNERLLRLVRHGQYSFVNDFDLFSLQEWNETPIYRDFLVPRGFGYGAATHVNTTERSHVMITMERRLERGPVDAKTLGYLNTLRPHLARALVLSGEVQRKRVDDILTGLSIAGVPAAVVSSKGRIINTNSVFDTLGSQLLVGSFDKILVKDQRSQALLLDALRLLDVAPVQSIPVPAADDGQAFIIHVIPLKNAARDLSTIGSAILVIARGQKAVSESTTLLKGLYDLSRAEARLAVHILNGSSLREVSRTDGISYETVRSTAKLAYAKTGSHSQTDLVRRLSLLTQI
jgi:DNA-binding CsgD family transcriptional regulator